MATVYQQRREQFMAQVGQGTAIFASAPLAVMHNDVEHPFRQTAISITSPALMNRVR
jgi:Xaa-Pro aminopeptidase